MKKIVLIDGNNLMFRSYYATAYSGKIMKNSKDFPTNALYGFVSMINKIVEEEKPEYMAVAFDVGKNFRKQEFSFYKEGRQQTPEELKMQMPVARTILDAMGIKYLELEPYEADDIIGSLVKKASLDADFDATIVSSDKDLLQLINFETDIKLLKQTGYIRYDEDSFKKDYGIEPIRIIDLKALMGDSSDNIPGVKGIGEKTALKLLQEYGSLEGVYENIDNIKGSVHDKLVTDKENAFMSKKIATIFLDVPLNVNLEDLKFNGPNVEELHKIYTELEFVSLLKNISITKEAPKEKIITVNDEVNVVLEEKISLYLELDDDVYTKANIIGAGVCDSKYNYYFDANNIKRLKEIIKDKEVITYDIKKDLYFLENNFKKIDDIMISAYLLGLNIKDDVPYLASFDGINIAPRNDLIKHNDYEGIKNAIMQKARYTYQKNDELIKKMQDENIYELYENIEMPLSVVLSSMEKEGICVDSSVLKDQGTQISKRIEEITKEIYKLAGEEFNIASVSQLGNILFEKLAIAKGKKNKTGYKTDVDTLEKIADKHPIVPLILEYRNLSKLKSTYIDGLISTIHDDHKIHTIFKQTIARTGRLSSIEPNLQNIPVRYELGKQIRKAFIPQNDLFLSCDYSQIELRILAHVTACKAMIDTFKNDGDIHAKVASDINGVDIKDVTKEMRSKAKAVIFGIVYGISGYGLGENLHISKKEADFFINKYYELYPEVRKYMEDTVKLAKETGYVTTLFNRKRVIDEIHNTNYMIRQMGERMAINTPIQGTAADIIKIAMIKVYQNINNKNLKSKMILQIHDELIFDVCNEELDILEKIVKDTMENVISLVVPLKVSTDVGKNWYETK